MTHDLRGRPECQVGSKAKTAIRNRFLLQDNLGQIQAELTGLRIKVAELSVHARVIEVVSIVGVDEARYLGASEE